MGPAQAGEHGHGKVQRMLQHEAELPRERKMLRGHVGVLKQAPCADVSGDGKDPQRSEDQAREHDESQRAPMPRPLPERPRHGLEQDKRELRRLAEHA